MFRIRKNERIPVTIASLFIILLNTLNVAKYYDRFHVITDNYHDLFWNIYHVTGYDLITYHTLSEWDVRYEVTRHPLMAFLMYPLSLLNQVLMTITGMNWATIIVAVLWSISAIYAFVFLFRILHELMALSVKEASLLCTLFFSMGFTMLAVFTPDHFGPSMTLLLMTLYIIGRKIKEKKDVGIVCTLLLFIATAGITLSNGIKVFLATLISNAKRFFSVRYLTMAVILPSVLMFAFALAEQGIFVQPKIDAQKEAQAIANKKHREELRKAYCDTAKIKDSATVEKAVKRIMHDEAWAKFRHNNKQAWRQHAGKPISKEGYASWTDISTPRWESLVENVFGEPVQMHKDHFIEDVNLSRPVIVKYNSMINYVVEAVLVVMMILGIITGRKTKIVLTVVSWFCFDMLIHFVLGFGLNEVYIMSPHYLFMFPICLAPLLLNKSIVKKISITLIAMLTLWLYYWNLSSLMPWFFEAL